jgi:NADH:ubiquinone reductase (H+-translocating)
MRDVKPRVVIVAGAAGGAELAAALGRRRVWTFNGALPKVGYLSLQIMHRDTLIGWWGPVTLMVADGLQRTVAPPVKPH